MARSRHGPVPRRGRAQIRSARSVGGAGSAGNHHPRRRLPATSCTCRQARLVAGRDALAPLGRALGDEGALVPAPRLARLLAASRPSRRNRTWAPRNSARNVAMGRLACRATSASSVSTSASRSQPSASQTRTVASPARMTRSSPLAPRTLFILENTISSSSGGGAGSGAGKATTTDDDSSPYLL